MVETVEIIQYVESLVINSAGTVLDGLIVCAQLVAAIAMFNARKIFFIKKVLRDKDE
jgi:hypothetical protein